MAYQTETLIRKIQRGDNQAFRQLVELYDRKVLGLAFRMLGNQHDAEDVYQEVFMRVYKNIHHFRFQSNFETWLYRIVVNTTINYRKTRAKHLHHASIYNEQDEEYTKTPVDDNPLPDEITLNKEIRDQIQIAIGHLTMIQRTVFILRFFQDFKIKDIAEIINCAEGTVKNTLFRSTQKMRHYLSKYINE